MDLTEDDLSRAVHQLPQGQRALNSLFYKLGFSYDSGFLAIGDNAPGVNALCDHPRKIAQACDGGLPVLWFPLANLTTDAERRLTGFYRHFFPHALFLFSNRDRHRWDFVCVRESHTQERFVFRIDLDSLNSTILHTVMKLSITENDTSAALLHSRLSTVLIESRNRESAESEESKRESRSWEEPVAWWLAQIGRYPMVSVDEELRLSIRAYRGDHNARNSLVMANLRLVFSIAKNYQWSGLPLSDLIQEGHLGLINAVDKFNPAAGTRLSTYATHWIKQAIGRAIDNKSRLIRLPSHINETVAKVNRAAEAIEKESGRTATATEISERSGVTLKKVLDLGWLPQKLVSLDMSVGDDHSTSLASLLVCSESVDPLSLVVQQEITESLDAVVAKLSKRDQLIIKRRYGLDDFDPCSLQDIADDLKISRERVRQIEAQAIRNALAIAKKQTKRSHTSCKQSKGLCGKDILEKNNSGICNEYLGRQYGDATRERVAGSFQDVVPGQGECIENSQLQCQDALSQINIADDNIENVNHDSPSSTTYSDALVASTATPLTSEEELDLSRLMQKPPGIRELKQDNEVCLECSSAVTLKPTFTGRWYRCSNCGDVRVIPHARVG